MPNICLFQAMRNPDMVFISNQSAFRKLCIGSQCFLPDKPLSLFNTVSCRFSLYIWVRMNHCIQTIYGISCFVSSMSSPNTIICFSSLEKCGCVLCSNFSNTDIEIEFSSAFFWACWILLPFNCSAFSLATTALYSIVYACILIVMLLLILCLKIIFIIPVLLHFFNGNVDSLFCNIFFLT